MSKKRKNFAVLGGLDLFAVALATASLFGFLGRLHWGLELFSHFRVQYMQLCLPLIGIHLWKRLNRRAVLLIALAMINYAFVLPLYFGKPDAPNVKPVRAMLININAGNENTALLLEAIQQADPDVLLLEEVTPKWNRKLKGLEEKYPHQITEARDDCFGIKLLSKLPLSHSSITTIGDSDLPSIVTILHTPHGEISFIGTHPLPPIGKKYAASRNAQLAALPAVIQQQKKPVLLMGDLNSSPWSPHFKSLIKESALKNSMKGFGFQPSWAGNAFLTIPIDHALHAAPITIHHRMIGPNVDSDHLPVIVDFSVR